MKFVLFSFSLFISIVGVSAQIVTFEAVPGIQNECDNLPNAYLESNFGVAFYQGGIGCDELKIGQYGPGNNEVAWIPDDIIDCDDVGINFGDFFITDVACGTSIDNRLGKVPEPIYMVLTNEYCRNVEGFIHDIDAQEAWTVEAYCTLHCHYVSSVQLCSQSNPACDFVSQGDRSATHWSICVPPMHNISHVRFTFTGIVNGNSFVGFALDNLSTCDNGDPYLELYKEAPVFPGCPSEDCKERFGKEAHSTLRTVQDFYVITYENGVLSLSPKIQQEEKNVNKISCYDQYGRLVFHKRLLSYNETIECDIQDDLGLYVLLLEGGDLNLTEKFLLSDLR